MSSMLNFTGVVLGVLTVCTGFITIGNYSEYGIPIGIGIMLVTQGIFIICLSNIIAKISEQLKTIKEDNLKYIEELVIYTKNQVKLINQPENKK